MQTRNILLNRIVEFTASMSEPVMFKNLFGILSKFLDTSVPEIASQFQTTEFMYPGSQINHFTSNVTFEVLDETTIIVSVDEQVALYIKEKDDVQRKIATTFTTLSAFRLSNDKTYIDGNHCFKPKLDVKVGGNHYELGVLLKDSVPMVPMCFLGLDQPDVAYTYVYPNQSKYIFIQKHIDEVFKLDINDEEIVYNILRSVERRRILGLTTNDVLSAQVNERMDPPIARDVKYTSTSMSLEIYIKHVRGVYLTKDELCDVWCQYLADVVSTSESATEEFSKYLEHV